jgi:transposase
VADYLRRATAARITWSEASTLAEVQPEEKLFPNEHLSSSVQRPLPDCEYIYNQLRTYRKYNLTLIQLWIEYKEAHPDGYQYTQFCEYYWRWQKKLDYCMRQLLVPDNLKSGVTDPCFYEPVLNPTYSVMAEHYGCVILPARPRKPRDKSVVENGVLIAQRWILAVLRHRTFYSLADLNMALNQCLERLNTRMLRKAKKSRREVFEALDHPNAYLMRFDGS